MTGNPTSQTTTPPPTTVPSQPENICLHPHVWRPLLQCGALHPHGRGNPCPRKAQKCRTFEEHCGKGWVLGTSFKYYRAWTVWIKTTRSLRISATIFHKQKYISNPAVTPANQVLSAAGALDKLLTTNVSNYLTNTSLTQLERLGSILNPEVPVPGGHAVGTKLGGRPRPLRGLDPSLVPDPRTRITVT